MEAARIARIAKKAEDRASLNIKETNNAQPRFLTKADRERIRSEKRQVVTAPPTIVVVKPIAIAQAPIPEKATIAQPPPHKGRTGKRKFKFEWDASEDTLGAAEYFEVSSYPTKTQLVKKELHWSEKALVDMTPRDWRIVQEDNDIVIRGKRIPNPARNWSELDLVPQLISNIAKAGYVKPSPIQMQAIPIGLNFRDVIGVAETGSGKTAAFAIPLICALVNAPVHLREKCSEEGPLAVVMAPVRELVQQIAEEILKLSANTELRVVVVVGGNSIQDQISKLSSGCEIVVATPGRLLDCLEHRYTVFNQVLFLALDEADRMIDMGFQPQVEKVLENMHSVQKSDIESEAIQQEAAVKKGEIIVRVTIMFSATMPAEVQSLAQTFLRFPVIVRIGDRDSGKNSKITQRVFYIPESKKPAKLLSLLQERPAPIIVFVNSRRGCDIVGDILQSAGQRCVVLHGGKAQAIREASLAGFISGKYSVLVATDVAGRGLDIDNVTHVINYEMASDIDRYCHRIGRTGRAGKAGLASTLVTEDDSDIFYDLVQYLKSTKMQIPKEIATHAKAMTKPGYAAEDVEELD